MQFELTKSFIDDLRASLHEGDTGAVAASIADLHPADVAEIIQQFHENDAFLFFELIEKDKRADVFLELDEDWRYALLDDLSSGDIAEQLINVIDSDDAADLISELPEKQQEEVMSLLEDDEQVAPHDISVLAGPCARPLVRHRQPTRVDIGRPVPRAHGGDERVEVDPLPE